MNLKEVEKDWLIDTIQVTYDEYYQHDKEMEEFIEGIILKLKLPPLDTSNSSN